MAKIIQFTDERANQIDSLQKRVDELTARVTELEEPLRCMECDAAVTREFADRPLDGQPADDGG